MSRFGSAVFVSPKKFTTFLYLWLIWCSWSGQIKGLKIMKHRCIVRSLNVFIEGRGFIGRYEGYMEYVVEVSYWIGGDYHTTFYS